MQVEPFAYPNVTSFVIFTEFLECLLTLRVLVPQFCGERGLTLLILKTVSARTTAVALPPTLTPIFSSTFYSASQTITAVFLDPYENILIPACNERLV